MKFFKKAYISVSPVVTFVILILGTKVLLNQSNIESDELLTVSIIVFSSAGEDLSIFSNHVSILSILEDQFSIIPKILVTNWGINLYIIKNTHTNNIIIDTEILIILDIFFILSLSLYFLDNSLINLLSK